MATRTPLTEAEKDYLERRKREDTTLEQIALVHGQGQLIGCHGIDLQIIPSWGARIRPRANSSIYR